MYRFLLSVLALVPVSLFAAHPYELDHEKRALVADGKIIRLFNHPVESLCHTKTPEGEYLFLTDDELGIHQLRVLEDEVTYIRKINVNPDTKKCAIVDDHVYYLDATSGVWRFPVNEEAPDGSEPVWLLQAQLDDEYLSVQKVKEGIQIELMLEGRPLRKTLDTPAQRVVYPSVTPSLETEVVPDIGDIADDPAIWVHPEDPGLSLIIGTDKARGLRVYDLAGNQRQELLVGRLNNVDLGRIGNTTIAVASNRTNKTIDLFRLNKQSQEFSYLDSQPVELDDPYGLCVATLNDSLNIFVGGKDGTLQWWRFDGMNFSLTDTTNLPSQTEGCAMDYNTGQLFIGVEAEGIWRFSLEGNRFTQVSITRTDRLTPDVEGLAVYESLLVASSQGDDSYVLFDLATMKPVIKFRIASDPEKGIDGASETDGLEVTSLPLPGYPRGILVVQDGRNRMPDETQNFKIVDMRDVLSLLDQSSR